jgi:hypothetical protein
MTARQEALAAYIRTIGPEMRGVKTMNQFLERLTGCVREDGVFVAANFAKGLLSMGKTKVDTGAPDAVKALTGIAAGIAAEWLTGLTKKRR